MIDINSQNNFLLNGDSLLVLKELPDNSIDSVVCDPPYGLGFMGKSWDTFDRNQFGKKGEEGENDLKVKKNFNILPRYKTDGLYDFSKNWGTEVLRVLKPGGHLLAFGGTRTYHKIVSGLEDAGFEIRDCLQWLYGSGFPKSYNISKGIQKVKDGGNASWNGTGDSSNGGLGYAKMQFNQGYRDKDYSNAHETKTKFTDEDAIKWDGYGSALKPANEPVVLARKPLSEKSIVENVLRWGVGGLNIDASRIGYINDLEKQKAIKMQNNPSQDIRNNSYNKIGIPNREENVRGDYSKGRFPSNVCFSCDCNYKLKNNISKEQKKDLMEWLYENA